MLHFNYLSVFDKWYLDLEKTMRKNAKAIALLLFISVWLLPDLLGQVPIPVRDGKHNKWSKILEDVQKASLVINQRVVVAVESIKDLQEFMSKASMIVSGVVKNIQLVKALIEQEKDIARLVSQSINRLNEPLDEDGDGIDDLDFLDKWKHIQILLGIAAEADGVFELFKNVIEEDAMIMDDRGRLTIIKEAYNDSFKIKSAIKTQIRRINREIYEYRRVRKELEIFDEFFGS